MADEWIKQEAAKIMAARILIVAPEITKPDTAAGDVRFFAMLQLLAKDNQVDFCAASEDPYVPKLARYVQGLQDIGVNVLKNSVHGVDLIILRRSYDIVLFEFWHTADYHMKVVRRQQPWARVVIDSVDIHFLREESGLALGISEPAVVLANKQCEIAAYQEADLVIVVTQEDREALRQSQVTKPLILVPMIVPIRAREEKERDQELLFVGGFHHAPNADGLLWFARECWPQVRAQAPDAKMTVVGSHPPQEVRDLDALPGIHVAGFVPETAPYLEKAYLSIAPIRFGAGMKGKVTEAMAAGVPVVTTTFGAQGLGAASGTHLLIGDGPDAFAGHIVTLLSAPERSAAIGYAGQEHIKGLCSAEVVEKQLMEIVSVLMAENRPGQSATSLWIFLCSHTQASGKLVLVSIKQTMKKVLRKVYRSKSTSKHAA